MASLDSAMGKALLSSGDFSDFTIHVKEWPFKVHRAILNPVSDHFKAILREGEGAFQEGINRWAIIPDTTALAFAKLLYWVYAYEMDFNLRDVYEIWPDLRPTDHESTEQHQTAMNELRLKGVMTEAEEDELEAEFNKIAHQDLVDNVHTCIRLYELAGKFFMDELQSEAADYVKEKLCGGLLMEPTPPGFYDYITLTPLETAQALQYIYEHIPHRLELRRDAMVCCIQHLNPNEPRMKVVTDTIQGDLEMEHDWKLGLAVQSMVRVLIASEAGDDDAEW